MLKIIFTSINFASFLLSVSLCAANQADTTPNDLELSFLQACSEGNLESIKDYVETKGKDPYVVDEKGRTGLVLAIQGDHQNVVEYLMRVASGIHLYLLANQTSALQIAVAFRNPNIVSRILELPPEGFPDYEFIKKESLALLHSRNASLLSPQEMAKQDNNVEILAILDKFAADNSAGE